jgi:hypothetical protein
MTINHGLNIVIPALSGSKNELFNNFRDWRKVAEILERFFGGFYGARNLLRGWIGSRLSANFRNTKREGNITNITHVNI